MAELRYTYLLDVKDMASRLVAQANARIAGSVERTNVAMRQQGTVAEAASRKVQTAGARQAAEWKQVERAARTAERSVAQSATQASQAVSRAVERQVAAQRRQGASYAQIARAQKAAGVSSRETAAAIEQSAARERRAYEQTAVAGARSRGKLASGLRRQVSDMKGLVGGLVATFGVLKGIQFVGDSVKQVGELARGTVKLSAVTGMDARTASQWLVIAKQRGLAARQLNQSFITLERNQVKAAAGSKLQAEAFAKLGISQADLKKLGTEQLIERVSDGFQRLGPGAQRAALAQQLFARGGQALIATLAGGGQKLRDLRKLVDEYGASLDAKGVKNAMRLVAEQRKLNLAMLGIKVSLGQALIPQLAKGAAALSTFILQIRQGKGPGGDFRRVIEGMAAGAKDVIAAAKPAAVALAGFVRQHPGVVKVAGAIVAVAAAARAIRFGAALLGITQLIAKARELRALSAAGGVAGGGVAATGGLTSKLATSAAIASRIGILVVASLTARQALEKLTAQANKSHSGVANVLGKVGEFVNTVGWKPIDAAASRLKKTFDQLAGISPKLANTSRQTTERLQQILGKGQGQSIAQSFATEAASAGHATQGMVQRVVAQLGRLKGDARLEARKAMKAMLDQMVSSGRLTKAAAQRVENGIASAFGPLKDDLSGAARRGIRAIIREFGALPGGITNPLRLSLSQTRSYMGRIINAVNLTVQQLRTMRALLAAGIEPVSPRSIGGGHRPKTGRRGGIASARGFRRYQHGGLVPAMLSPGELVVHGNAGMVVPGQPAAADNVPMLLPVGAAVLTGDGQRRMAAGASVAQAVASQAPHFRTGGHVRGRVSWFGGPHDSQDSGRTALGLTTATPGVAIRPGDTWQTGRPTLGQYWRVRLRNGRSAVLRQTDLGPNQSTGRRIDLTYSALSRFGYREGNFPTDSIGVADLVGKGAAAGGAGTPGYSYRVSGLAQAQARRVGPSRTRQGLVSDAYQQGFDQGVAGLTRSRLAREPDTAYRAIAGAYRLPAARTVNVPGKPGGGGRPGGGGGSRRLVEASRPIRDTWAWARAIAAKFGLTISSSYRTPARNRAVGGVPNSWHTRGSARRPQAFDFVPPNGRALGWVRKYTHPDEAMIHNAGSGLHLHVGGLYRRGGWARFQRGGVTGRLAPTWTGVDPSGRGATGGFPAYGRTLAAALGRAMTWASGTFAKLNSTIQRAAEAKLGALRSRLQAAVRRGGTEAVVKRLQAALDLVDKELGRRAGLLERRITQRTTASDRRTARGDIALRQAGIDPESVGGLTARLHTAADAGKDLWRNRRDMERQLRIAGRARNTAEIARIKDALADNMTAILDSRATQRELGRARDDARKSARLAFVAGLTQIQTDRVGLAQTGRQTLELQQRLAGTYDTGGQARADYITQNVIPALQAEREGLRLQGIEAMRQNNADLARQLRQAWEEKGNDILQAQLDAQEETARNTADTADALKNLGGTLSFEFQGSRLTDDLLSSGVGA